MFSREEEVPLEFLEQEVRLINKHGSNNLMKKVEFNFMIFSLGIKYKYYVLPGQV
tara:strand:- start:222 stop:386 length:165 start_codon:yes stop_codon:yes gene_type:complete